MLRTGCPWRDLPECYGKWQTVYSRFRLWCRQGLFARILAQLGRKAVGSLRHLDSSHIKLHQHGANPRGGQATQAMGRTKGGLNTKLSAVVDGWGRALAVSLDCGQRHDLLAALPVLGAARGHCLVADRGVDADNFRARLLRQRSRPCIPPKRRRLHRVRFHRGYYRHRRQVENFFGRIKAHRRISTRYDKLAETFLGFVQLAAALDWLTHGFSNTP